MAKLFNEFLLWYDRDSNIAPPEGGAIEPVEISDYNSTYGTSVTFTSNARTMVYGDNYYNYTPVNINSLQATYNIVLSENKEETEKIVNELEQKGGHQLVNLNPDPSIYRDIVGYCDAYSVEHINSDDFNISITAAVDEAPNLLNWKSLDFVKYEYREWVVNKFYKKDDIIYYKNVETESFYKNKLNNFYYCSKDHFSQATLPPTEYFSPWQQEFHWCPDANWKNDVAFDITRFDGEFKKRHKTQKNAAMFPIDFKFSAINTKQTKAMLHFLENKAGYRRFRLQLPTIYNRPKIVMAINWTHEWVGCDSHNLTVRLIEDPLGAEPSRHEWTEFL
jgi:phage-related protein